MKRLYLKLNDTGSGDVTYPLDRAEASNITIGSWVDLKYRGTSLGGFWAENIEQVPVNTQERSGRILHASGRGALSILDQAILWDWGTPALDMVRYFKTVTGGNQFTTAMHHKGEIFHQLIHEATESQTNPSSDTMDRECWHDSGSNLMLAHTFTDTLDSSSDAWDANEDVDLNIAVGTTYLDIIRQFAALGQPTTGLAFDINADYAPTTGITTLNIYQTPIGKSSSDADTHFRVGHNCVSVSDVQNIAELRNAGMAAFVGPAGPVTGLTEQTASISSYFRREILVQASNAYAAADALVFGDKLVANLYNPKRYITLKVSDAASIKYGTHYNLGDHVYYDDGTGTEATYRIYGIQLEWDNDYYLNATLELRNYAT